MASLSGLRGPLAQRVMTPALNPCVDQIGRNSTNGGRLISAHDDGRVEGQGAACRGKGSDRPDQNEDGGVGRESQRVNGRDSKQQRTQEPRQQRGQPETNRNSGGDHFQLSPTVSQSTPPRLAPRATRIPISGVRRRRTCERTACKPTAASNVASARKARGAGERIARAQTFHSGISIRLDAIDGLRFVDLPDALPDRINDTCGMLRCTEQKNTAGRRAVRLQRNVVLHFLAPRVARTHLRHVFRDSDDRQPVILFSRAEARTHR